MTMITRLKIPKNHKAKLDIIKKYASKKSFWIEFDDDRPFNDEDYLKFLLPVASKLRRLDVIGDKEKGDILRRLKALWDVSAETMEVESTPQDLVVNFFNFSLIKMYEAIDEAEVLLSTLDIIYEGYFTEERIDNFNKFSIIK